MSSEHSFFFSEFPAIIVMSESKEDIQVTQEELEAILAPLLEPYQREVELQELKFKEKEREIVILKHAANDVLKKISKFKNELKKLPKSKFNSEVLEDPQADCAVGKDG